MAQLLDVGGPLPGFGRKEVIEEVDRVLAGEEGGRLAGGDTPVQLQALVHGQLARGVGAGEVAGLIPQQGEDHGGRLGQLDLLIGAKGAVAEAGDQPPFSRRLHIAAGPVAAGYVGVGGGGRLAHSVPAGGGLDDHGDKLRPGHLGGQVQVAAAVPGHDAQGGHRLGGVLQGNGVPRRRDGQGKGKGQAERQKRGKKAFYFHGVTSFLA